MKSTNITKNDLKQIKLFIGPMSKNIVDAAIEYQSDLTTQTIGFIPSRRQIEYNGGYVNKWTTKEFSEYVNGRLIVERDHGGQLQGKDSHDDHLISFHHDVMYMDLIHIDPWKKYQNIMAAADATIRLINWCNSLNDNCYYEIGTEEAIRKLDIDELHQFVKLVKSQLSNSTFNKIAYLVIQSGTALSEDKNIGFFNQDRLSAMLELCSQYKLLSKEHNGDFIAASEIKARYSAGLNAINVAPEFGQLETNCHIKHFKETGRFDHLNKMFDICLKSKKWMKWVPQGFDPYVNKDVLTKITGHYIFSDDEFINIKPDNDDEIKTIIKYKIGEIVG